MLPISVEGVFDRVAVDVLCPFPWPNKGSRHIVVFSDWRNSYYKTVNSSQTDFRRREYRLMGAIFYPETVAGFLVPLFYLVACENNRFCASAKESS